MQQYELTTRLSTKAICLACACHGLVFSACSGNEAPIGAAEPAPIDLSEASGGDNTEASGGDNTEASGGDNTEQAPPEAGATYILGTLVSTADETLGYVSVLDSLAPQAIDLSRAREFSGQADTWAYDGSVFVTNGEDLSISKFSVRDGALALEGQVSFAAYGLTTFGFWINTFVSPDKAYVLNDTREYIVWSPASMQITGTVPLPQPEAPPGFRLFTGYSDRAAVLKDGLLYQPFYWTDESFFLFAPESRITVLDVATDRVVGEIVAPCPGLDYATLDEDDNIYFSGWVYAAGGATVLDQPPTCVFEVPAQGEPRVAFDVASLTEGREGGVLSYVGNGRALLSVLHDERFDLSGGASASELTFAANWRFWSYDLAAGTAQSIDPVDWNAGAQYSFDIDQRTYMLVARDVYSATTLYDVSDGQTLTRVLDTEGWATRLFRLR
jgi:hypothetical protein